MEREIAPGMAEAIAARMKELDLYPAALIEATGLTGPGIMPVRKGERKAYQARLTGPLCKALGWTPDSIERLMRGEPPVELRSTVKPAEHDADPLSALQAQVNDLSAELLAVQDHLKSLAQDVARLTGHGPEQEREGSH